MTDMASHDPRRSSATWAAARSCIATSLPSRRRAATGSWPTSCARRAPVFFNTFAQGYWVFTRHDAVRDIYKTPELFSSESITPWQPDPIYRFVPTQIDAPDHIKYRRIVNPWFSPRAMDAAEPRDARPLPAARRGRGPDGRVRLRHGVRACASRPRRS